MELNEIKKTIYKEKPSAEIIHVKKDGILYDCQIDGDQTNEAGRLLYMRVYFLVPLTDLGEAPFLRYMPAQLLIRYIIDEPKY